MLDKEAIHSLDTNTAEAIRAASTALLMDGDAMALAAMPEHFKIHDLEKYLPYRRRARGKMETQSIEDFAQYVARQKLPGAAVFIHTDNMTAVAILNLGTAADPGHADDRAVFEANPTAAYRAMTGVAYGGSITQQRAAEFLEDWAMYISCYHDGEFIHTSKAIAAVREITIEGLRKIGATEGQLSASRTTFEEVKASGKEQIPTLIEFSCEPYAGLDSRCFRIRLGIQTGGDKPSLVLRIVKQEEHQESMGRELADKLFKAINTDDGQSDVEVLLGAYSVGA